MKTLKLTMYCSLIVLVAACSSKTKKTEPQNKTPEPFLEMVWQTDSLMTTSESVLYHKESGVIYVANVNESPWEIDHNGFISTIDTSGNILELKWVEGMSGPKGMGIVGDRLFVNDINRVVEIDMKERKIVNEYPVDGKPDLNDLTVSSEGVVYASGSSSETIYALQNGNMDAVLVKDLARLNGLLSAKEGMYYVTSKASEFGICNLKDGSLNVLTTEIGHGDGIVRLPNDDFIVSNWKGEVFYISAKDWSKKQLLDTREKNINAADIDFIPESNLLLVPTFFNNRVVAYRLKYK
ncbi:hypothetical protein [Saccharicrinis sp. 156]|uniref:hypothetical protein n=1 Tax=Saccharicrinis sp. 156 TaxID=3417574 RepID=UPI003D327343